MDELEPNKEPASHWVIVNSVNVSKNVIALESDGKTDSDLESDGISVISESSNVHESNTDEEGISIELQNQEVIPEVTKTEYAEKEPVIELSDNDLDSVHSETSDLLESNSTHEDEIEDLDFSNRYEMVQVALQSQQHGTNFFSSNSIFMGIVILITSLLLGLFLTEKIDEDPTVYNDINQENLAPTDKYDQYQNDIVEYCIEKHTKGQGLIGTKINACVKKTKTKLNRKPSKLLETDIMFENLDLYLKLKERLLEVKERALLLRERRLLKAELGIRKRYKQIRALHAQQKFYNSNGNTETVYEKMSTDTFKTVPPDDTEETMKTYLKVKGNMKVSKENLGVRNFKFKENIKNILRENKGPEVVKDYNKESKAKYKLEGNSLKKKVKMENRNGVKLQFEPPKSEERKLKEIDKYKKRKIDHDNNWEDKEYKKKDSLEDKHKKQKKNKPSSNKEYKNIESKETKMFENKYPKINRLEKKEKAFKRKNEKHYRHSAQNKQKNNLDAFLDNEIVWFLSHFSPERYYEVIENFTRWSYDSVKKDSLNSTVSGNWYIHLHQGRDNIRKREHMADWYFDRSYMRKLQRMDRAKWYFDWMSSRDKVRYTY